MGNPDIKKGILSIKNPQSYILKLSLGCGIILVLLLYFLRDT